MSHALARLASLDASIMQAGIRPRGHGRAMLKWADCLLRAERPSMKRIEQCIAALRSEFGIEV